ncbi:MAG TPA: hypothetical protein VN397_01070 [Candidatus Methylomirabilis sp.]|nr:hypothetical protein [Candidatus Methylomirabilis sp.]
MDRRTKFILLIIGSIILFGLVIWLIVFPTLAPLFPAKPSLQPPSLPTEGTPPVIQPGQPKPPGATTPGPAPSGVSSFTPTAAANPEQQLILELSRRAGVLAERVESGSSGDGFTNLDDAALDASPSLASKLQQMKTDLQKQYPAAGSTHLTIARRLLEAPESEVSISGPTFKVAVQLQIQTQDAGAVSSAYREATVTFTKSGDAWIASGYETKAFTP